jgi:hypothetical protein
MIFLFAFNYIKTANKNKRNNNEKQIFPNQFKILLKWFLEFKMMLICLCGVMC